MPPIVKHLIEMEVKGRLVRSATSQEACVYFKMLLTRVEIKCVCVCLLLVTQQHLDLFAVMNHAD